MASGRRDDAERARAQSVRGECNDLRVRPSVRPRSLDKERKNCGREVIYLDQVEHEDGKVRSGWDGGGAAPEERRGRLRVGLDLPSQVWFRE